MGLGAGGHDLADAEDALALGLKLLRGGVRLVRRHAKHEADAAVEGAQHFRLLDGAGLLQPVEDVGPWPGVGVNPRRQPVAGQHAGHVFQEAAAGDVGHAAHLGFGQQGEHRTGVDAGRRQQRLG